MLLFLSQEAILLSYHLALYLKIFAQLSQLGLEVLGSLLIVAGLVLGCLQLFLAFL